LLCRSRTDVAREPCLQPRGGLALSQPGLSQLGASARRSFLRPGRRRHAASEEDRGRRLATDHRWSVAGPPSRHVERGRLGAGALAWATCPALTRSLPVRRISARRAASSLQVRDGRRSSGGAWEVGTVRKTLRCVGGSRRGAALRRRCLLRPYTALVGYFQLASFHVSVLLRRSRTHHTRWGRDFPQYRTTSRGYIGSDLPRGRGRVAPAPFRRHRWCSAAG
jgi:hypothetical protein